MRKNDHALTLRIDTHLDDVISEASYERRISKSEWIRVALYYFLKTVDRTFHI
jgi:hypothetical protein